jgi:hypothetical protein
MAWSISATFSASVVPKDIDVNISVISPVSTTPKDKAWSISARFAALAAEESFS